MKIRSLNYPQKYKYDNVNLIISANFLRATVSSGLTIVTNPAMTERIEQFIRENPDYSNLLPLNEPVRRRNVDIQLTWTSFHRLTAVVRNFKGDFESWLLSNVNEDVELEGEKPWVIWETPARWNRTTYNTYIDYEKSAWPHGDYVEQFYPCGSCGIAITESTDNQTSCSECGASIHGGGDCGPWDSDYDTAMCVECYEAATGEAYGGHNRLEPNFSQLVAETITDEDIRQTLTFIQETFNTFEWR
jgi:hypothetical protein